MMSKTFPFPKLTSDNYNRWCIQMKTFLGGHDVWDAVETGIDALLATAAMSAKTQREAKVRDQEALSILQQSVDDGNFERISGCSNAKEAWNLLELTYKGLEKVQRMRLQTLRSEFEDLKQKKDELITYFCARDQNIENQLKQNGEKIGEIKVVEKIMRSLDERFDFIVDFIEESKDVSKLSVQELLGSLLGHEEKLTRRGKDVPDSEQVLKAKMKNEDQEEL